MPRKKVKRRGPVCKKRKAQNTEEAADLEERERLLEMVENDADDLTDVVFPNRAETQDADAVHDVDMYNKIDIGSSGLTSPDIIEETLNEAEDFFGKDCQEPKTVRKAPVSVQRCSWSQEEENEIKDLFKRFFESKVRPKPSDCLKAIKRSKNKNGPICKRKKDVLKKKVFRMIDKLLS